VADGEMRRPALPAAPAPETPALPPGWSFANQFAIYDGKIIKGISPSRVRLLRVLADAIAPLKADELAKEVYGPHGDAENARNHIRALREELRKEFGYEGDPVPNDGQGYRLALR
jgi:hypothetical protein